MKLKNISASKYEFTIAKEGDKAKPLTFAVPPGGEIEIEEGHPESMKKLAEQYPKDWIEISEKKKTAAELKAELAKREAEEKAEADAKAKAEAAAAKAKKDADKKGDGKGEGDKA